MATEKQVLANRKNAQKSTGPRSPQGKEKVSGNRITRGILSNKLLLEGESPDEYQTLLDDLLGQLRPAGALELALVEKIAAILWRQRRLVCAETATVALGMYHSRIAREVGSCMRLFGYVGEQIEPVDYFAPPDRDQMKQLDWWWAVIAECNAAGSLNLDTLSKVAPLTYAQLARDAEAEKETIAEHLADAALDESSAS